ncbi:FadR/GntR family transcriptional regulator [Sphingomonas flavescens]|jgi:DNA-binding FadR family transcriptional regulator|uniref:FadR/GntR family transcriptional regulator n=1 Tax=Sphingomonas flavescens TaxID=3132797 RepID=UPI0028063A9D|nr:FadR/GntR family transcriptional regulator [Sphingomonas limnosediminicola]
MATSRVQGSRPRKITRRPTEELKTRLHQSLARDLGSKILSGEYSPGESLPGEIAASQQHQVSRNAYREAVRILAAKGLVESRQKAGTLVTERSRWNLLDPDVLDWALSNDPTPEFRAALYELRAIVEPAAASLAALRRSDQDLAAMASALEEMRVNEPDSPSAEQADERFHAALFTAAGNDVLSRLASIIAASVKFIAEYKREQHIDRDTWPDHKAIFDAVKARRSGQAHNAMERLIAHAREDTETADSIRPKRVRK